MSDLKRSLSTLLAAAGLAALAFTGCDVSEGGADGGDAANPEADAGGDMAQPEPDATPTTKYYAILVEDLWDPDTCGTADTAGCCGSGIKTKYAPGADIDAVELQYGGEVAYWAFVDGDIPTTSSKCDGNSKTDLETAKGAPYDPPAGASEDGIFDDEYVALHGGWIIGEFENEIELLANDVVKVWEVGDKHDLIAAGTDEPFSVSAATDLDCPHSDDPEGCQVLLSDDANGTATVTVSGF